MFLLKSNKKAYVLYQMVMLPMTLVAPNYPKPPQFLYFALPLLSLWWVNVEISNLVYRLIILSPSLGRQTLKGSGHVAWPI